MSSSTSGHNSPPEGWKPWMSGEVRAVSAVYTHSQPGNTSAGEKWQQRVQELEKQPCHQNDSVASFIWDDSQGQIQHWVQPVTKGDAGSAGTRFRLAQRWLASGNTKQSLLCPAPLCLKLWQDLGLSS